MNYGSRNHKNCLSFSTIIQMMNKEAPNDYTKNIDGGLFFVLLSI